LHEITRLSSLALIVPSPASGFHSSYYLGLGWGFAEAVWGIVQGWEQMSLYEDVMKEEDGTLMLKTDLEVDHDNGRIQGDNAEELDEALYQNIDESELERRVEILERMRGRRGQQVVNVAVHR